VKPEVISADEFCAFCFGPLATGWNVERRGRHYCTPEHADADQRKRDAVAAIDEFTTTPQPPLDQLELGAFDG
jgi:hypothetical protein